MTHQLRFAARSDRGLLRANNQDSVYAGERLLIVADGMGGHAAGDLASRVVVAAFAPLDAQPPRSDLQALLKRAVSDGNDAIAELVDEDPDLDGMGTTATAMLFDGDRMAMAHVGDSRAYLYRNGVLHQLSHDDTFVQSLVDDGRITEDEAAVHPQRNLLLRALNGADTDPMLTVREISTGDRFLICSDGLSSVIGAEAIADGLANPDPEVAADRLIELALVAGGPDNVTVIVADVIEVGARSEPPAVPAAGGGYDPDATGPIKPIHITQKMPRVPLPGYPEDTPARPEYVSEDDEGEGDDEFDDDDDDDYPDDDDDDDAITGPIPLVGAAPVRRTPRWRRRGALIFAAVVLVAVVAAGALLWTRSQYYVGASAGRVVVYKGVDGSVFGLSLASVEEDSCEGQPAGCVPITIDDLVPAARDQVDDGIPAPDLSAARAVMTRLSGELLPYCPADTATGTPGTDTTTGGSAPGSIEQSTASTSGTVVPPTTHSPAHATGHSTPHSTARPTARKTAKTVAHTSTHATVPPKTAPPPRTATNPRSVLIVTSRPGDKLRAGNPALLPATAPDAAAQSQTAVPSNNVTTNGSATGIDPTACRVRH